MEWKWCNICQCYQWQHLYTGGWWCPVCLASNEIESTANTTDKSYSEITMEKSYAPR